MQSNLSERLAKLPEAQRRQAIQKLKNIGVDESILPIVAERPAKMVPLSYAQRALWVTWRMAPESTAYNMSGSLIVEGALERETLALAIGDLYERHEILRTAFPAADTLEPFQDIRAVPPDALAAYDVSSRSQSEAEDAAFSISKTLADTPFDLEQAPPCRFALIKLSDELHWLVIVVHHIIADDWSQSVLIGDLAELYESRLAARASRLPLLPIQYADYAVWQRDQCAAEEFDRQFQYWKHRLSDDPTVLSLPLDRRRSSVRSEDASAVRFSLDQKLALRVREIASSHDASVFMVMMSILKILLWRFTGQSNICVGMPIANRERRETHGLVGYFANMLVARTEVRGEVAFSEFLADVRRTILEAQENKICPFDYLVQQLPITRARGVHPMFQVKCTEISAVSGHDSFRSLDAVLKSIGTGKAHFDLSLDFVVRKQAIDCSFQYATDVLDGSTVSRFAQAYISFVEQIAFSPTGSLAGFALPELRWALSKEAKDYPLHSVLALCAGALHEKSESVCVESDAERVCYRTLDARASQVAHRLIALRVGTDVCVGLHAPRSVEFVVGMLAVWKAGGVNVPLDPQLPARRLAYQLQDSGARVLLSTSAVDWAEGISVIDLAAANESAASDEHEKLLLPEVHPSQPAYVIYTSGSTGKPKGVVVSHGALSNYVQGVLETLALPEAVRQFAMVSTVSADLGHTVLFGALCSGRTLHLISPECAFDPDRFARYMREHRIEVLKIVPSHLQRLLSAAHPEDVLPAHTLILGGEATPWPLLERVRELKPSCRVINHYGPTETTVGVLTHEAQQDRLEIAETLPIGTPLPNTQGYVLDAYLNPTPQGVAGELYLGGSGLAQGYQGCSDLTAERFVASAFKEGERLYRTGDRVRLLKDGSVEFLGRMDDQVKVRGYRVEPKEIASALKAQPRVRAAEVIARTSEDGRTHLHGYVVPEADTALDSQALQAHLATLLPEYMVPSAIVVLEALPLTANGKLDRKALPEPGRVENCYEAPQGEIEELLVGIWTELLGVERVNRHDNFFELGGDSILTLQIVARARKRGIRISPRVLMERQTIASIAPLAESLREIPDLIHDEPVSSLELFALTPIQRWFFEQHFEEPHHWNQSLMLEPSEVINVTLLQQAVKHLIDHHGALRLSFQEQDGHWQQRYKPEVSDPYFDATDLSAEQNVTDAITRTAGQVQRSLTLQHPFHARWMDLGAGTGRLLLAAHHLVVDGVSWRVLLEDLQQIYTQLRDGREVQFPAKSTTLYRWSRTLQAHANRLVAEELPYWSAVVGEAEPSLPCSRPHGSNTVADAASVSITLDEVSTERLLTQAPQAYRTQINDLLLAALAHTLCEWSDRESVLIELEGHGRDELAVGMDLSRTVGWFTALHPVRLTPQADPASSVKTIKEQLRRVPNKGLGYGLLRHLTPEGSVLAAGAYPQVTFNYLGQLDQSFDERSMWRVAKESAGADRSPKSHRRCWFNVGAQIYKRRLSLSWAYSRALHSREEAQQLLDRYQTHLQALLDHCTSGVRGITPSDVRLARLTQAQLDALPVPVEQIEDLYPMTPLQQGLLFHSVDDPASGAYINQLRVDIEGLEVPRFKAAWQAVIERHDVLRTGFLNVDESSLQWVAKDLIPSFIETTNTGRTDSSAIDELARELRRPFEILHPPLMRFALLRTQQNRYHFIWTHHHLLTDGWSTGQVIGEVLHHYHTQSLQPLRTRYRDYIEWLQHRDRQASERYWKVNLQRVEERTSLAGALPKRQSGEGYGEHVEHSDEESTNRAVAFAKSERVTLNTMAQGALALLLSRYTNQVCVSFGVATSGRPAELPGIEQLIGLFVNTFPLVAEVRPEKTVGEWLRELQAQNVASREHEHTPLYEIQRWAGMGGSSLFDVVLAFQNYPVDETLRSHSERTVRFSGIEHQDPTHYPMTIQAIQGSTLRFRYRYRCDSFTEKTVVEIADYVRQVFETFSIDANRPIGEIEPKSSVEHAFLDYVGLRTKEFPSVSSVQHLIEHQARRVPSVVAVIFDDQSLSYGDLNRRSNQLAHRLISLGVGPEVRVGIALERSIDLVVGLLAILKAGGAYVPLDPAYPAERLSYMMHDSGIKLLLTQSVVTDRLPIVEGITALQLDALDLDGEFEHDPGVPVHPDTLVYVIYTSGSTGQPKGAQLCHRNVARLLAATHEWFHFNDRDVWTLFHSYAFDFSVWEIFGALCYGGKLVIVPYEVSRSPEEFLSLLRREQVTVLNQTPSAFKQLLQVPALYSADDLALRAVIFGGEALDVQSLRPWLGHFGDLKPRLINMYGITEMTVHVTYRPITKADLDIDSSPIGERIPDLGMRVLDAHLNAVPVGVRGELYVAGGGLARGYLARPGLTAERFVADSTSHGGERLYRTGDLVRWNRDGQLEYGGRIDHQVKIRGFRIELGEIESQLLVQAEVSEAVVIAQQQGGDQRLLAYVVPDTDALNAQSRSVDAPSREALVTQWESVFENTYEDENIAPSFRGWNSSYTDQPIPEVDMQEWLHSTVGRIRALKPQRILEIGCGVGLLVQHLAPQASVYVGTDLSARAVKDLGAWIKTQPALSHVQLRQAEATDFTGIQAGEFDTVVLNSVVQYLPDIDYLVEVLKGAAQVIAPHGRLFIGDLRHLAHVPMFHASVHLSKASAQTTVRQLKSRIQRAISQDMELVLDPAFFHTLSAHLGMGNVDILLKRGQFDNELTRYRYDVVMHKEIIEVPASEAFAQFDGLGADAMERLAAHLATHPPAVTWQTVFNRRLARDLMTWKLLQSSDGQTAVGELLALVEKQAIAGINPEALWELGEKHGYTVRVSWSSNTTEGSFDAEFVEPSTLTTHHSSTQSYVEMPSHWRSLASDPMRAARLQQLGSRLRQRLSNVLPDYMIPAHFTVLEELPLNVNGKLDRKALPEPEAINRGIYEAPQGTAEEVLAAIWSDVLGVERIGRHDSFFELGGHSLMAIRIASHARRVLGCELSLRTIFENPTLSEQARAISSLRKWAHAPVFHAKSAAVDRPPLSYAQQRLWFLWRLDSQSASMNSSTVLRMNGQLDHDAWQFAWRFLVARHPILRTVFREEEGYVWQHVVNETDSPHLNVVDLSARGDDKEMHMEKCIANEMRRPFDLKRGPLLRVHLFRLAEEAHVMCVVMHHIVTDGWSVDLMIRDFVAAYIARLRGDVPNLPPLSIQYTDFAIGQREWLEKGETQRQLAYWTTRLNGVSPLIVPPDKLPPAERRYPCGVMRTSLDHETTATLRAFSESRSATPFMILLMAACVSLGQRSQQRSFLVGTDLANRNHPETESLVGFFVNQAALPIDFESPQSARDLLKQVKSTVIGAADHQDLPFDRLVESLRVDRRTRRRAPLFQVKVLYQERKASSVALSDLQIEEYVMESAEVELDLILMFYADPEQIHFTIKYDRELFEASTLECIGQEIMAVLKVVLDGQDVDLDTLRAEATRVRRTFEARQMSERSRKLAQSRAGLRTRSATVSG